MKPLLIASLGRALSGAPVGRRDADIELRRVPALPNPGALDPARPTVVLVDRAMLASVGPDRDRLTEVARIAALVGWGDPGDDEPPPHFPVELMTSFLPGSAAPSLVLQQLRGAFRHAASLVAERAARDA